MEYILQIAKDNQQIDYKKHNDDPKQQIEYKKCFEQLTAKAVSDSLIEMLNKSQYKDEYKTKLNELNTKIFVLIQNVGFHGDEPTGAKSKIALFYTCNKEILQAQEIAHVDKQTNTKLVMNRLFLLEDKPDKLIFVNSHDCYKDNFCKTGSCDKDNVFDAGF